MTENKTQPTSASVDEFIEGNENTRRRADAVVALEMYKAVTDLPPVMWGPSIIGFGTHHYVYDSGREGIVPAAGFSPRKANMTFYVGDEFEGAEALYARLGKHKKSAACLYINKLSRRIRQVFIEKGVWRIAYAPYGENPLNVTPNGTTRETYLEIGRKARSQTHPAFLNSLKETFGHLPPESFIHDLALPTQVVVKNSDILYLHGYLLYGALRRYLDEHPEIVAPNILETGTARGFGTVCMAKALADSESAGKITSIDILPSQEAIYWNCIRDLEGKSTRFELLDHWKELVENHIIFLQGHTQIVLRQLGMSRIHFAFLDGGHDYETLRMELAYVSARQRPGDIVICDDYDESQFPGVIQAVEEAVSSGLYKGRLFQSHGNRGYMYCTRQEST